MKKARGAGIAGWAAANRRGVLNADPALDLGHIAGSLEPPLRSSLTVPLAHEGRVVGVLSCYASNAQGFTEDHMRLLELLAASLAAAVASVGGEKSGAMPRAAAPRRANVLVMAQVGAPRSIAKVPKLPESPKLESRSRMSVRGFRFGGFGSFGGLGDRLITRLTVIPGSAILTILQFWQFWQLTVDHSKSLTPAEGRLTMTSARVPICAAYPSATAAVNASHVVGVDERNRAAAETRAGQSRPMTPCAERSTARQDVQLAARHLVYRSRRLSCDAIIVRPAAGEIAGRNRRREDFRPPVLLDDVQGAPERDFVHPRARPFEQRAIDVA